MTERIVAIAVLVGCSGSAPPAPVAAESPPVANMAAAPADAAPAAETFEVDRAAAEQCTERMKALAGNPESEADHELLLDVAHCYFDAGSIGAAITIWSEVERHGANEAQRAAAQACLVIGYERADVIEPGRFTSDIEKARKRLGAKYGDPDAACAPR